MKGAEAKGADPLFRNISDTARWVAMYRARESERPDAHFKDPLARRLAGERGAAQERELENERRNEWAFVARTVALDDFIRAEVARGIDLVVNLAAGFDARPYRLELPARLQWIEVDLPPLIAEKSATLANEKPRCALERIPFDLADGAARRELFAKLGARGRDALIVTEGLLAYLSEQEVTALARDLAAVPSFRHWIMDLASPALMQMLQQGLGARLAAAGMPLRFGPADGPDFFRPLGWQPRRIESTLKTAGRLGRLPFFLSMMSHLPEGERPWKRIWAGNCLFERAPA